MLCAIQRFFFFLFFLSFDKDEFTVAYIHWDSWEERPKNGKLTKVKG